MAISLGQLLDEGRWTGYQKLLIFGTALTIILDGIDNQLVGTVIPALMDEWSLPRGAFTTALALGPMGMLVGGVLGGMLGDRIGHRTALLGSVVAFGAVTLGIATINDVFMLGLARFIAGLGLGGAMPNAAALAAEYVPRAQRPFAVTLTIVCIPLGGTLAAVLSGQIVPQYGWRALFAVGGAAAIVVGLVLFRLLPESPFYLAGRPTRRAELIRLLRRIGHDVPADASFVAPAPERGHKARVSVRVLFTPEFRRDTIGLMGAFFFGLLANYLAFIWIVTMLMGAGFSQVVASNNLGVFNFGGVGGAILGALTIQRFGSRVTMLSLSAVAVVCSLAMAGMTLDPHRTLGLTAMFAVTGSLLGMVQTTMYALAAHVYPTEIRSTGVGTTVAGGRVGNVLSSYVGSWALDIGGPSAFFLTWAVCMAVVFVSLAVVRRHI